MGEWQTIRTFHLDEPFIFKGREIPVNAIWCLKQPPTGSQYWQAFWREHGKMQSVHIGKELPFPEPDPKPTVEELMLTVSKLQEENRQLTERIRELEASTIHLDFPAINITTFEGHDGVLRAEAAILTIANDSRLLEIHVYPDKAYALRYRPGKRLWKVIDQAEAIKIFRRWRKGEIQYSFAKSQSPERRVEVKLSALVTAQECLEKVLS